MYIAHCNLSLKLGVFAADNTTDLHRIYTRIYTLLCKYTIYIGLIRDTTIYSRYITVESVYTYEHLICCPEEVMTEVMVLSDDMIDVR